ncbi:WbqC family protein [Collimonas sp. NPDC087041]|uniref:WbqC family protein n=1 Tax=Collimonas sp. NPDC087041 TaxID=3363960 RepID=UPI003812EDBA
MKLALMQPYLFPYIGYFQLVAAADKFVFYDDVNFIKNGWINRNRLMLDGDIRYITVPLAGASPAKKINEVLMQPRERWLRKLLESIRHAYAKAPHYQRVSELIHEILHVDATHVSQIASRGVIEISRYLDLGTTFAMTSTVYRNSELRGAQRVLDICAQERASTYLNLPGGRALYDAEEFAAAGIDLSYIEPNLGPYPQFGKRFHPGLSIIDVLMFNSVDQIKAMLHRRPGA